MTYGIKTSKRKERKNSYDIKNYKSFADLQKEVRKKGAKDYFKVKGVIYTQEEYDFGGQEIRYSNKRTNTGFIIKTKNRYEEGFSDAEIEYSENWGFFRNDISYID